LLACFIVASFVKQKCLISVILDVRFLTSRTHLARPFGPVSAHPLLLALHDALLETNVYDYPPGRVIEAFPEKKLALGFTGSHAFSSVSVRAHAPIASGVYGISNAREWIYIGETDNIQLRLLEHLAESGTALKARGPTGFTFEVCDPEARPARQDRLVLQYEPVCNRQSEQWHGRKA
jgi:hypothetical protein